MIGVMYLEMNNSEMNATEKVDNTKITAQVLSEQERLSAQIVDNRKEIYELTEAELNELGEIAKQYGRNSWKYSEYLKKNFKHIGEEIPEDVPFSEYHDYILWNFRITKPRAEWTDIDYKVYNSWRARCFVLFSIKEHGWKEPFNDRQKRIIERVRNGTDYDILADECPEWFH